MNVRSSLAAAALVIATAAITTQVVSQNGDMPQMSPEEVEMMQKIIEAGTPGKAHEELKRRIGKWDGAVKMWMAPEAPAGESTCTVESKWIMGNRFVKETVEGQFGGQTFQGLSLVGYDNTAQHYTSMWIDNMSTGMMTSNGKFDSSTRTFTYASEYWCPMTGKPCKSRIVERWLDNDRYVMEMFGPHPKTGEEYKHMEITYTRAN